MQTPFILSSIFIMYRGIFAMLAGVLLIGIPSSLQAADEEDETDEIIAKVEVDKTDPHAGEYWRIVELLKSDKPAEVEQARHALIKLADEEYSHAQYLLGTCYYSGLFNFKKNQRKAVDLFELAAENGNAFAKASLGASYAAGTGVWKNYKKAIGWLEAALAADADYSIPERPSPPLSANNENEPSGPAAPAIAGAIFRDPIVTARTATHFLLGQLLTHEEKKEEAQEHFVTAATAGPDGRDGLYLAAIQAALNYAFGNGAERDMDKANAMLEQSRKLTGRLGATIIHNYANLKQVDDFAVVQVEEEFAERSEKVQRALELRIANMLGNKKSKDYNATEAARWYQVAAENGQAWGMLELAFMHVDGDLGAPDPAQAFKWFEQAGSGDRPKHWLGLANLAICYANGYGTPRDPEKARALFEKYKDREIVCYLGSIGQCPTKPMTYKEVLDLTIRLAKKNDPHAQYLLGQRYMKAHGVDLDFSEGIKWFKKAAKKNQPGALYELGDLCQDYPSRMGLKWDEKRFPTAAEYFRKAADLGNHDAMIALAKLQAEGLGMAVDLIAAERNYQKVITLDPANAKAHYQLAELYKQMLTDAAKSPDTAKADALREKMLAHYTKATELEYAVAPQALGELYYTGTLVPQDYAKAYDYLEQGVDLGRTSLHFVLGHMHEYGEGMPITYTEAAYHYRMAALQGHRDALRRLINFYVGGQGDSVDLERAAFWLTAALRRGDLEVLPTLCDILAEKRSYAELVPLLRNMTKLEDKKLQGYAYFRLSLCYRHGLGVRVSERRAEKYLTRASQLGYGDSLYEMAVDLLKKGSTAEGMAQLHKAAESSAPAKFHLGNCYYFGKNVTQDKSRGVAYITEAAEVGETNALYFMAALTQNRWEGAPDLDQAIRYARQADNRGHPKAGDLLQKLESRRKNENSSPEENTRVRTS